MLLNCGVGKDFEGPLDCKEIQPVIPKGNQSWLFIGRTDAVAETPILWPPGAMNCLIWKDPDTGKDWRKEEKGMTEDEMVGWHLTQWTWVWAWSRSWWWTQNPGMLQSMGSQRVRHDWVTELNWTELRKNKAKLSSSRSQRVSHNWATKHGTYYQVLDGITDSVHTSFSKLRAIVKDKEAWHAAVHGVAKSQTWLSDRTITIIKYKRRDLKIQEKSILKTSEN